jgi:glycosyltransferase involved in cell wall biosynthesis
MKRSSPSILLAVSSLSAGGAERVISEMASWWAARGRTVTVLTLSGTEQDHYKLAPGVGRIALNFWGRVKTPWQAIDKRVDRFLRLRSAVIEAAPDVVISFIDITNMRTLTALMGTGIPVVVSERIDPRHHDIGYFWSLSRRLLYPLADALVVQTEAVTAWGRRVVPERKLKVIGNFIRDLPEPDNSSDDPLGGCPAIVSVGRLVDQKGHDLLIRAFAMADAARTGWKLAILPGVVDEPAQWLRRARFFVLASRYEGFPNALLEAMACGCAVISADCPSGPAEIVRDGENGLLVPPDDAAALSRAMLGLMGDEDLRRRLGEEAVKVKTAMSRDSVMGVWDALVETIAKKGDNA